MDMQRFLAEFLKSFYFKKKFEVSYRLIKEKNLKKLISLAMLLFFAVVAAAQNEPSEKIEQIVSGDNVKAQQFSLEWNEDSYPMTQTIDLSTVTADLVVQDGDVLTGSTSHNVTIANGASITLNGVTITGGIVCEGTATITLDGTNSVNVTSDKHLGYKKAGIKIGGSGTTLTIRGSGSLTVTGGSTAAGIGLGRTWDENVTAGAIVIEGGTVNASGDIGFGIGTVGNKKTASIDGISIKGGTVNASLGKGTINYGCEATIGYIKIYDSIDMVDASKITETVTYMHVENGTETDVTANNTDYFTFGENGDRRIIVPKDDNDYTITIAEGIGHGTLSVAAATAKYMQTVTVTATPAFGYRFVRLVVKDAQNNDVASTNNTFLMPKGNVTISAVFEQGVHGTTEFAWGHYEQGFVTDATIYDGVTTVNILYPVDGKPYLICKDEYANDCFLLDNNTSNAEIPYSGGTGTFDHLFSTNFYNYGQTGYYDVTLTDVGNDKWYVSILKTVGQMDVIPDQTYTGSEITPEPLVIAGSLDLTKGTDYTYSYENNTNVGMATVRATFLGEYEELGYVEKEFRIVKQLSHSDITIDDIPDQIYTGSAICPEVSITDGENALELNTDYKVECSNNVNVGTATMTITGINNYTGIAEKTFAIVAKNLTIANVSDISDQTYTGSAICPKVSVTDGEKGLARDVDYSVECSNNVNAGTATMTITGNGNYTETVEKTFEITRALLTVTVSGDTITYGDEIPTEFYYTVKGLINGELLNDVQLNGVTISCGDCAISGYLAVGDHDLSISVDPTSNPNYDVKAVDNKLTVRHKKLTITDVTAKNRDYNGEKNVDLDGRNMTMEGYVENSDVSVDLSKAKGMMEDANVGKDKIVTVTGIKLSGADAGNYDLKYSQNLTVTINKATPTVTAPTPIANLVYTGSAQPLVTAGETDFGTLLYSLDNKDFSAEIPATSDASTYTVYYKVAEDDNWNAVEANSVKVEIKPDTVLASGAVKILKDQNGVRAVLDGEYETDKKVVEISDVKVDSVVFKRTFKEGAFSTIMLPFSINVNKVSGADFYQITDIEVKINDNGDKKDTIWGPVTITQVNKEIKANTPYLLGPTKTSLSFDIGKEGVVLNTSEMKPYTFTKEGVQWEFRGTYHYFDFGNDSTQLIKKSYGFAAKDQDNGVGIGKFSWTSDRSFILPMRCYLVYNRLEDNENNNGNGDDGEPNDDGEPKPQMLNAPSRSIHASIPETLEVVIVDEKGGRTVIGTINTRSGELRLKPRPKHTYDLNGRRVNATRKANKGMYVER